ncbi:metallophosphoesterase family protein [Clostridium felsineum]|uniref:3',5'-cyclic adenosine monophosphate phosphodiesterase CpdA n=2 Tax=Clostridium felsineum TaxID=36839 RepID=A0A1S8L4V6_9CLOT|nr:metallophosphoesterase family protein [Clostridium felsineum]MCR3761453.1 metallophosphoesterase family protein [Clostridium felsineum]URZ00648.1 3',5'-cyclic adenosine monophosphate phosphodiesterase CpdA [Clostridium felsineum]URZ06712.1 3',5'-cyclic adenosine monophosphate phosphodiesterase CpdA [Clostridium felsineum]URZ11745.1 3',5'-cyclic adenosine monophosphate phosphodiesterase CpdA [Clostridium felsineum]
MIHTKRVFKTNMILFCEFAFFLNILNGSSIFKSQKLKFNNEGKFKIVQFTDLHQNDSINLKTVHFMEKVIDSEKPDFVMLTGDNIDGRYCMNITYKKAIESIVKPMEERKIPWAVVLGNHDTESIDVKRKDMVKEYTKYQYNMNKLTEENEFNLLVMNSKDSLPIFNMYMLDSGDYSDDGGYGCIELSQVNWYKETSSGLRKKYKHIIPAIMFFHIPLIQYNEAFEKNNLSGERREKICYQGKDTGLLKEIQKQGDVKAIFVGHDHTNDFIGKVGDVFLGYGRCTGYDAYDDSNYERGARIILLNEKDTSKFKTWETLDKNLK